MKKKLSLLLLLIAVGLLTALAATPVFGGNHENDVDKAKEAKDNHAERLLATEGIVGVGVGSTAEGQVVVVVYTTQRGVPVPKKLDDVSVKAVVTGLIVARSCHNPIERCDRPVPIGVSTGHPDITAGTIGARVKDGSNNVYALSNNHVYAKMNEASINDPVIQPGTFDDGSSPADDIGTLSDYEPLVFSYQECQDGASDPDCNTMDAAIAISTTALLGNATLDGGYGTPSSNPVSATVNQAVRKCGRRTGCTEGTVSETDLTVDVCYKARGRFMCNTNYIARFVDQIAIIDGDFSGPGDSGSLIVDGSENPVALLFAGSSARTIASPIGPVLDRFNVTIDDSWSAPTPGITVTPTSGLVTTEDLGTATFTVVLDTLPSHTVSIALSSSDTTEGTVSPDGLTFTQANWNTPQTVTVTGVNDDEIDGDIAYRIVTAAAGSYDPYYGGTDPADVSVTNIDNDSPPGADKMGVFGISWTSKKKSLHFTVNIRQDSDGNVGLTSGDSTVESARVLATLCHIGGTCWSNFGGDTNADGNVTFKLVGGAPMGNYEATITDLTYNPAPPVWDDSLDVGKPWTFLRE